MLCRVLLAVALATITWLALTPSPPEAVGSFLGWDKANHGLAFFVLASLAFYSTEQKEWYAWAALALYGVLIEILQWYLGYRFFELLDILADLVGILICILSRPVLLRLPIFGMLKH